MRYGETKVSAGVEGADLLVEYEAKKAAYLKMKQENPGMDDGDDEGEEMVLMNDLEEDEDGDEEAPDLVVIESSENNNDHSNASEGEDGDKADGALDLSKMTPEERERLKQEVSSTRIFSASDFVKMRKLVQREERLRRDPREAARRKRAIARGQEFEELSDDSSVDSDEEEAIHVKGAVNPYDIMAAAKRKRQSKAEKLEKILAGREKFEAKERAGGSTNTEKERRKNFLMSKSSRGARSKGRGKGGLSAKRGNGQAQMGHEAKKRRRKV